MLIDLTLKIKKEMVKIASENEIKVLFGHIGTHFDVMNKTFPLNYTRRKGIVFDISDIQDREIDISDIQLDDVKKDMCVLFFSGFIEKEGYGKPSYFHNHPQLSNNLIKELVNKEISIIGIDFAGVRRGIEHVKADQYCADNNVFVVENLCNIKKLISEMNKDKKRELFINTYPMSYENLTGLPCRVIAEL